MTKSIQFLGAGLALVGLIGTSLLMWHVYQARQNAYEPIHFSYTKYPHYQKQVVALLAKNNNGIEVDPQYLAVGLTDLNDDGNNEIIVISWATRISGVCGCYTGIYSQSRHGLQLLWDKHLTYGHLAKKAHKTNGYHDILSFVAGNSFAKAPYLKHTLSWVSCDGYEYLGSEPMTMQEKEALKHEIL